MTSVSLPFRYAAVGLLCAALHNAVMITLDGFRVHYVAATAISYIPVVLAGYALHTTVTFREQRSARSFLRYAVAMATNYPLTVALLFALCNGADLPIVVAAPSATVMLFCWNFVASRWAIVTRKSLFPKATSQAPEPT